MRIILTALTHIRVIKPQHSLNAHKVKLNLKQARYSQYRFLTTIGRLQNSICYSWRRSVWFILQCDEAL
nr:unnamed protein product [Callosobruchus analis]